MQDDQVEQTDEAVEPTAEDTSAEAEGASDDAGADAAADDDSAADDSADDGASDEDAQTAAAVDMSAAQSAGSTVLAEPEVPDDANDKILAAQEHINSLNMDEERDAAEKAQKQL
ncbi:MAG: hypothetical protein QOG42_1930 [Solirubrobacteraceae bacterium]|nr:hypothetical protein [Solirubrobacteraceae bacterium]